MKTVQFGRFSYIGDPTNTVRIFNELEVDELAFLDITATIDDREPNLDLLADIANECFMPLSYGGGIRTFDHARAILGIGYEKIIVNSQAFEEPALITRLADHFGSQAVIASIDVRRDAEGLPRVWARSGTRDTGRDPVDWAREMEGLGAGEILLTSIDREGTWSGYRHRTRSIGRRRRERASDCARGSLNSRGHHGGDPPRWRIGGRCWEHGRVSTPGHGGARELPFT